MISLINHSYLLVIDLRILWKKQKKLGKNKLKNMGVPKYQIFFRKKKWFSWMRLVCVCYAGSLVVRYSFTHKPFTDLSTLTVSPCVTRVQCLSHGPTVFHRFFFSHGFTNFELISSQTQFSEKKTNIHRQHIPMLLKNTFLEWLTKTKQAVTVLYIWLGNYCSLSLWRHILITHFIENHHLICRK